MISNNISARRQITSRFARYGAALALVAGIGAAFPAAEVESHQNAYRLHSLVSSSAAIPANHVDANLVNVWGIVLAPNRPAWVSDGGTGLSTVYDGTGAPRTLVVTIPGGSPTGIVFNETGDFAIMGNSPTPVASSFLFATENGIIAGWNSAANTTNAITAVDSSAKGSVYKGLAMAATGTGNFLYATDFHNGRIDVFDKSFQPVAMASGAFTDPRLPTGFAPFGIRNINGNLYVTYAMQDAAAHDDVKGAGLGFVNVFDASGKLIRRLATRESLNAPWGLALAPADFGKFSNMLLVGNFGDGRINAYDLASGEFRGQLRGVGGAPLTIDGLWGISFGNGVQQQPVNALFFGAGPNGEAQGMYGRIEVMPQP